MCIFQMQTLLLGVSVLLLLCFGSAFVCANEGNTSRRTLFEAYTNTALSSGSKDEYQQFVYSYHFPSLTEVEGLMVAVTEARYGYYKSNYTGEVVAKYSADQGKTWKTIVAIRRKTKNKYARSINPTVVTYKKNLLLFAERFEDWNYDWTDSKSGDGDFVYSLSHNATTGWGSSAKQTLTVFQPSSLLPELSDGINKLQITRLIGGIGKGIEVNGTAIVPVAFYKNKNEVYSTVLLFGSSNWRLAKGTVGPGTLESAVVEWEGKLIMNARTNNGYRKVYESADMGNTWNEALGSLSRVWGNSPNRQGYGTSASFITVNIENTPVMLFSHPLNTKGVWIRDKLHLWLTDNKRIYDVGQISADAENTGHSSLLYTNDSLHCLYEKERYGKLSYYSSVLAHLVDELKKIKAIVKKWKKQDNAFSEPCDGKDPKPSYPGSTCEVHIPQDGLVGFLSNEVKQNKWKDAYNCVDAIKTHGLKVKNGIKFDGFGGGVWWPVGRQEQNQRYHFMNHEFTLAATMIIDRCSNQTKVPVLRVVLDTDRTNLFGIWCIHTGELLNEHGETISKVKTGLLNKPLSIVATHQKGNIRLYINGSMLQSFHRPTKSGLLSTPISYICILQCEVGSPRLHAKATVQNVLLYNRVLNTKEIKFLYHQIIHTKTPTISQTTSHTNSISKTLSITETTSRSLSHTTSESKSLSLVLDAIEGGSGKGVKQVPLSKNGKYSFNLTKSKDENKHSDDQSGSLGSTQNTLKTSDGSCPSIVVETFPAGDLTQRDIDGSNNVKRMLLISLPKRYNWPNNESFGSFISFSGGSGEKQLNGFSGKWGEMLRNAKWHRNAEDPRSVLEAEIPTYSNYDIKSNEKVLISVDAKAFRFNCHGTLKGSFIIRAENLSPIVKSAKMLTSVIAGMTTVTIFCAGGPGSILEIQALSLLSRMNCAPKEERYGFNLLPYFTSIFVHFGSLWIVLGNALIVVSFGSIHYFLTMVYKLIRGNDSSKSWARMRFPNISYFVAYIMHIGIFVYSVSLLFIPKAEWHHYAVGIAGTSYGFGFPFFVMYYVTHYIVIQFVPYQHSVSKSLLKRCLSPLGYWTPRNQVKMYGSIFFTMKGGYLYWCVFHLSVISIAGIVTVIPTTTENCHIQYFCLMGIFLFGSIVTAVANIMRSVFLTSMHTLSFFLLATLCFVGGLNYIVPITFLFNAYFVLSVVVLLIVFMISIYNVVIVFYDWMNETNNLIDRNTMKEPFTQNKYKKDTSERNTLPYGKEDPFSLLQSNNQSIIRNEPYGN